MYYRSARSASLAFALTAVVRQVHSTESPTTSSWGTVSQWGDDYKTTFETMTSLTCETQPSPGGIPDCQAGKRFPDASEYYNLCYSLTSAIVPNKQTGTGTQAQIDADIASGGTGADAQGFVTHMPSNFRIDTDNTRPGGCTIGTAANGDTTLFYNQAGTGACGDGTAGSNPACICECQQATATPTASPTLQGVDHTTLDCVAMPDDQVGYSAGVGTELVVSDFNRTDKRVKVQPYINWASTDLYNRDTNFHLTAYGAGGAQDNNVDTVDAALPWPSVSAWVDIVKVRDYPYQELTETAANGCRFSLDHANEGHFPNEWINADCYDAVGDTYNTGLVGSVHEGDVVWTNYSFYVATTVCYTSLTPTDCEAGGIGGAGADASWSSEAYLYPTQYTAAYNHFIPANSPASGTANDAHIGTCRRTWQQVSMRAKYGAEVNILDNLELITTAVVQLDDGSIAEPDSEETWQKYQDFGPQQVEQHHIRLKRFERDTGADTVSTADRLAVATETVGDWNAKVDGNGVYIQPEDITAGSAVNGVPVLNFGHRYVFDFEIKPGLKFNEFVDNSIAEMVAAQYNRLEVTHTWQKFDVLAQDWVDITDEYLIYGTNTNDGTHVNDGYYRYDAGTTAWITDSSTSATGVSAILGNLQEGLFEDWKLDHHNFRPNGAPDSEGRTCEDVGHAPYDEDTCNHNPLSVTHFAVEGMIEKINNVNLEDSVRLKVNLLWSASGGGRRLKQLRGEFVAGVVNPADADLGDHRALAEATPAPAPAPATPDDLVIKIRFVDEGYHSIFDDAHGVSKKEDEEVAAGLLVALVFALVSVCVVGVTVFKLG